MHRIRRKKLGNNMEKAQFIVPLQPSYNQPTNPNYYKIIYDTLFHLFLIIFVSSLCHSLERGNPA